MKQKFQIFINGAFAEAAVMTSPCSATSGQHGTIICNLPADTATVDVQVTSADGAYGFTGTVTVPASGTHPNVINIDLAPL